MSQDEIRDPELEKKILEIAQLPDEEAVKIVGHIEALHFHLRGILESTLALKPLIDAVSLMDYEGSILQEKRTGSPLCDTCAVFDVCGKKGPKVVRCDDWRQKVPDCVNCVFWDVESCVSAEPCEGGSNFVAKKTAVEV